MSSSTENSAGFVRESVAAREIASAPRPVVIEGRPIDSDGALPCTKIGDLKTVDLIATIETDERSGSVRNDDVIYVEEVADVPRQRSDEPFMFIKHAPSQGRDSDHSFSASRFRGPRLLSQTNSHLSAESFLSNHDSIAVNKEDKKFKYWEFAFIMISMVTITVAMSALSYIIAIRLGVYSLGTLGVQLQEEIALVIRAQINARLDPLANYLKGMVDFVDENALDVNKWEDLRLLMPVMHSFLRNYFDDARCCSGAFVNMQFPSDARPFANDSAVLSCHAIAHPDCPAPSAMGPESKWVGVLHWSNTYAEETGFYSQVLPTIPYGSAENELYFKSYEGSTRMQDDNPERPVGFVPLPYADGWWFHEIVKHRLRSGDVRFAPVFPFDLYPPTVLKTHGFTTLDKDGQPYAALVVGFKLHWLSAFLESTRMAEGMFIMLVERHTGHLIATSDPALALLSAQAKPIATWDHADARVRRLQDKVLSAFPHSEGWVDVEAWKSNPISNTPSAGDTIRDGSDAAQDFVVTFDFRSWGLDWVGVIEIPYAAILGDASRRQLEVGIITVIIAIALKLVGTGLQDAGHWYLFRRGKKQEEGGSDIPTSAHPEAAATHATQVVRSMMH